MAIPKVYNNAPTAGRISWDSFVILYKNVPYFVPSGNTASKWVYWIFNNGAPSIQAAAVLPTFTQDDLILFSNRDGIALRIQQTSLIDGELLVNGTIIGNAIKANEIQSTHIVTAGLDAGVIKFGLMSGDRISVNTLRGDKILANSIAVSKLMIASLDNMIEDPGYTQPLGTLTVVGDEPWEPATTGIMITPAVGRVTGEPAMVFVSNGTAKSVSNPVMPSAENRYYRCGFWIHSTAALAAGAAYMRLRSLRQNGTTGLDSLLSVPAITANTWTFVTGILNTAAVSADAFRAQISLGITSSVTSGATVKFDSFPTCTRANAGELIVDGTIIAQHIKVGEITGDKMNATVIFASKTLKGGTVLGASLQTSQTANAGPRMEINEDAGGGFIVGYTAPSGGVDTAPVRINPRILGTGNARRQSLYLSSGAFGGGIATVDIISGSVDSLTPARVILDGDIYLKQVTYVEGNMKVAAGQTLVYDAYIGGGVTGASVNNAGAFIRTSSSRTQKDSIERLSLEDASKVLKMESVSFVWRPEMEMGNARQAGFIAEQTAEAGAEFWLTRNDEGKPSGVRYPEVTVAHNVIIKDLLERISVLEAR